MKNIKRISVALAAVAMLAVACQKDQGDSPLPTPKVAQGQYDYLTYEPPGIFNGTTIFGNLPVGQEMTNERVTLGRVLFYDGHLSKNNLISCGSCHQQSKGFADPARFSTGFKLGKTTRNSMALSNLGMQQEYFWDLRAKNLEEQVLMPVQNHVEMGIENLDVLPQKLSHVPYYAGLFEAAFGDPQPSEGRIRIALAQFLRSMATANSRYDQGTLNEFSDFNELERMGMELFTHWDSPAGCVNCHNGFNFTGWNGRHNIGLDANPTDKGAGNGEFKIPSLRNVAVTAPYMHDGRFSTLEEVVNHYDHGVQDNPNLDWALRDETTGGPKRLNLTDLEKKALVAFLKTLTDEEFLTNPKFSDPFQ